MKIPGYIKVQLSLLTILMISTLGFSQESQGGEPYSFNNNLSRITPIFELPFVDSDALKTEDSENTPGSPFRYGIRLPVDFSPETSGSWETLIDGTRIWKLQIFSRGAYALNIGFDSFYLPKDSKLFIYNPDHSIVYGAYTEMNNNVEEILHIYDKINEIRGMNCTIVTNTNNDDEAYSLIRAFGFPIKEMIAPAEAAKVAAAKVAAEEERGAPAAAVGITRSRS